MQMHKGSVGCGQHQRDIERMGIEIMIVSKITLTLDNVSLAYLKKRADKETEGNVSLLMRKIIASLND